MLLRALGLAKRKGPAPRGRANLPHVHTFVDVEIARGPRGAVAFEAVQDDTFTVQALPGMHAGHVGIFSYQNGSGKFRFSATCHAIRGRHAVFTIPSRIETVQAFAGVQQRAAVRLQATLPTQWRYAFAGKGQGDFNRTSMTDISRTGASLVCDREMKRGAQLEMKFSISTASAPLVLLAEVMRSSQVEASGKITLGVRFSGLKPDEDRAIMEFINKRQAERRSRGFA